MGIKSLKAVYPLFAYIMENEIWKENTDYNYTFLVSNLGNVKILENGIYEDVKERKDNSGYRVLGFMIKKNKKLITESFHRLVAETFITNPENKKCVNHKNGIKNDNRVENLEWCTYKENSQHARKTGLLKQYCKLNEKQVRVIKHLGSIKSKMNQGEIEEIAKIFKVNTATIKAIIQNKIWKHIII